MTTFSVIGAGNLGSNLIFALRGSQYSFKYIYNRSKYPLFSSHIEASLEKVISGSDVIFISVQESGISEAVNEIGSMKNLSGKIFFHTSNSLTSDELIPLRDKGGIVASFSPLQTFPEFTKDDLTASLALVNRRNEELHSGSAAFDEYPPSQWLVGFYRACSSLSAAMGESLTSLFGEDEAIFAEEILTENRDKIKHKVCSAIAAHKKVFYAKSSDEQAAARTEAENMGLEMSIQRHHR